MTSGLHSVDKWSALSGSLGTKSLDILPGQNAVTAFLLAASSQLVALGAQPQALLGEGWFQSTCFGITTRAREREPLGRSRSVLSTLWFVAFHRGQIARISNLISLANGSNVFSQLCSRLFGTTLPHCPSARRGAPHVCAWCCSPQGYLAHEKPDHPRTLQ